MESPIFIMDHFFSLSEKLYLPVNINILRPKAHGTCFDRIRHVGLIEHTYGRDLNIIYSQHPSLRSTSSRSYIFYL